MSGDVRPTARSNKPPPGDVTAAIPQSDEALHALIEQFKGAPSSEAAMVALMRELVARGHASEAVAVADRGLQSAPLSVEGRIERASAFLALSRPRLAYVELRRVLVLSPGNRRALRLLGRAFKDAGAPHRAAELLSPRYGSASVSTSVRQTTAHKTQVDIPVQAFAAPPQADPHREALFKELTADLGLGGAVPQAAHSQPVEVTQLVRRRMQPLPPRSESELTAIEGPIVDSAQAKLLEEVLDELEVVEEGPEPILLTEPADEEPLLPASSPSPQVADAPTHLSRLPTRTPEPKPRWPLGVTLVSAGSVLALLLLGAWLWLFHSTGS